MSTILVGVDTSEQSDDAIVLARDLANATAGRIVLAAAVPYPAVSLIPEAEMAGLADEVERETRDMLERKAALLADAPSEVKLVTRLYYSAPHLLQSLAETEHADLIVVGSTSVGRAGRVLPASTSERLLHGAPCPVAVAPTGYGGRADRPLRRIGVGYDGSEESRAALKGAVAVASRLGANLEVVTVLEVMSFGSPALMSGPGYDRTRASFEATARNHLDGIVAELPSGVRPTGRLLSGDPAEQLIEHSGELDLMLVGSRRYGPLRAVLLGGVSGRLIAHATCPVIVTPRGVDRPLDGLFAPATTASER